MKNDFMELTRDINQEIECADNKNTFGGCRNEETRELFQNWTETKPSRVTGLNGRVLSRCENGHWIVPSHQCLCGEQAAARMTRVNPFEFKCEAARKFELAESSL